MDRGPGNSEISDDADRSDRLLHAPHLSGATRDGALPVGGAEDFSHYRILSDEIQAAQRRGFSAAADFSQPQDMDAVIRCVPTPFDECRRPDLSYIRKTAESIAPHLRVGLLIVMESTPLWITYFAT